MNNLVRRIERLEEKLQAKSEGGIIHIIPNLEENDQETTYKVKVSHELWAHAIGRGPFTKEEVRSLREKYGGEEKTDEECTNMPHP